MADETKICKYCQTEIPKNAKICPHCRKKQGPKVGLIIAIVLVVLLIIGVAGGSGDDDKSSKVDNSNATKVTESESTKDSSTEESSDESNDSSGIVQVGGSYEDNGLKFTVNNAELDYHFDDKYGFYKLDDGLVYLKVDFTFENTGNSDKYVSIYDFDCYADNTNCEQKYVTDVTGDFINQNLSSGRNVSFTCLYAVPGDATSIELEYSSNIWTSEKVIVQIK